MQALWRNVRNPVSVSLQSLSIIPLFVVGAKNHCVQHISIYRYNCVHYQIISHIWKRLIVVTSILKQKFAFFLLSPSENSKYRLNYFLLDVLSQLYFNFNIHRPKTVSHKKQTKKHLHLMCLSQFWGNCKLFLATSLYLDAHLSKVKKKKFIFAQPIKMFAHLKKIIRD